MQKTPVFTKKMVNLFKKGALVEVSSNEEGFKDARYEATIIKSPWTASFGTRKKRPLVQYKTLVTDEDSDKSQPLKEYVSEAFLRPLPPKITRSYELYDIVDAFFRDGWWKGAVTKVDLENSMYTVFFENPPDEAEFSGADLRVHFDWVKGKWVEAGKLQRTAVLNFSVGTPVEVNLYKDNSTDVWFPATFLGEYGINYYKVEYRIFKQGGEVELKNDTVDSLHIRPSPPCLEDMCFEMFEKVDVFYDSGWQLGVITQVLNGRRYVVTLKFSEEQKELNHGEIRRHLEWTDGKWVSDSKEISQQKGGVNSGNKRERGPSKVLAKRLHASVECKEHNEAVGYSDEMAITDCTILPTTTGKSGMTSEMKRKGRPPKILFKKLDASVEGGMSSKMKRKGMPSVVLAKRIKASAEGKEHNEAVGASGEMVVKICTQLPTITGVVNQQKEGGMSNEMKRKGRPSKLPVKRLKASAEGKEHTEAVGGASGEMVIEDHSRLLTITGEISQQRVGGVSSEVKRKGRPSKVSVKRLEAPAEGNEPNEAVGAAGGMVVEEPSKLSPSNGETCQEKGGGSTSQKKRRGRPPKVLVETASAAGMKGSRPKITIKLPSKKYLKNIREQKQLPIRSTKLNNKGSDIKRMSSLKKVKLPKEIAGQVLGKHIDKHSSKRGRKPSKTKNIKPLTQDSQEALGEKVAEISQTEKVLLSNISEDDQPLLLMWYKGMNCQNDVDDSRLSLGRTDEQLNEGTLDKNRSLSFVKRSPVWTTLESLEVFQKMPQNPHFQPLDSQKEEFREGLAVADMVNFSNLVSKTSELQITDPRSTFNSSLEALLPLEMNGFDVKVVRERLNKLLSMKISQEYRQDQSKQAGSQIAELIREKVNIDAENEEREKKIRELLEKRASLVSRRDVNDFEINAWKSSVNVVNEDIRSAKAEFERIVAAPW